MGLGKDWSSFVTEPAVKRFLRAGNIVLEEETWEGIPKVNQLAVEAAAEGLGLSIEKLRARLQNTTLEETSISTSYKAISVKPDGGREGDKEQIIPCEDDHGDVGTIGVDATSELVQSRDEEIANIKGGPLSATGKKVGDSYKCLSIEEICKKMEMMQVRNDELERRIKQQEEEKEEMRATIRTMEMIQEEKIERMAAQIESLLRK